LRPGGEIQAGLAATPLRAVATTSGTSTAGLRFPAASRAVIPRTYGPSGTSVPAVSRPFQVIAPAPAGTEMVRERTIAPPLFRTSACSVAASDTVNGRRAVSFRPSPFGETRVGAPVPPVSVSTGGVASRARTDPVLTGRLPESSVAVAATR
jgi:hypothetical protein